MASSYVVTDIGGGKRYDWNCSIAGKSEPSYKCSSGVISLSNEASCGTLAATLGSDGSVSVVSSSYCTEGWPEAISCTTASSSISCTWLCRAQSGTASTSCSGTAFVD